MEVPIIGAGTISDGKKSFYDERTFLSQCRRNETNSIELRIAELLKLNKNVEDII